MKRLIRTALAVVTLLCTAACARHTIIPDDELAQIFHDAFLTNAYIGSQNVRIDSLNIYEPIFARYGYTTEDVQYTIGNFSKRKSARLGDVVELAIDRLEEEGKRYDREVAILTRSTTWRGGPSRARCFRTRSSACGRCATRPG